VPSLRKTRKAEAPKRSRLRALPWALLLQIAMVMRDRWRRLSAKDRARVAELLRESQGRAGNLNSRQRDELRKLVRKLDLKGAAKDLAPLMRGGARGKKRR
jgi:hypothetical protein